MLIPQLPAIGVICPITNLPDVVIAEPSAVNIASLSIKALLTLRSWNISKLVSSANNFCIEPLIGSTLLVIYSATLNWFVWFIPVLELNIPEYIREFPLRAWASCSSTIYAFTP